WLWVITTVLGTVVAIETRAIRPDLWWELTNRLLCISLLVVAAAGGCAVVYGYRWNRDQWAFAGSCTLIASIMAARAAAAVPVLIHSTIDPEQSMNAYQVATRHQSLSIALVWWVMGVTLAAVWHFLASRNFRGRVAAGFSNRAD